MDQQRNAVWGNSKREASYYPQKNFKMFVCTERGMMILTPIPSIGSVLGQYHLMGSMNRRSDYSNQEPFQCSYGNSTTVLRQTWKMVNLSFKCRVGRVVWPCLKAEVFYICCEHLQSTAKVKNRTNGNNGTLSQRHAWCCVQSLAGKVMEVVVGRMKKRAWEGCLNPAYFHTWMHHPQFQCQDNVGEGDLRRYATDKHGPVLLDLVL